MLQFKKVLKGQNTITITQAAEVLQYLSQSFQMKKSKKLIKQMKRSVLNDPDLELDSFEVSEFKEMASIMQDLNRLMYKVDYTKLI